MAFCLGGCGVDKSCKDCRWVINDPDTHWALWDCGREQRWPRNLVTGLFYDLKPNCAEERCYDWLGALISNKCGKRGRYWEAKNG